MSYKAMYRVFRPTDFNELVGQEHISTTLKNALKTDRLAHAYLFCGPRGTGKTSSAKILAKAVNCLNPIDGEPCNNCANCQAINEDRFPDVIEIDAATNRGIDEIRELRDKIRFAPANGKKKVYIIDEVHMLTNEAFNALLKTLEEPPEYVLFIMATTEANKVPLTVLSRCQRFDFRQIAPQKVKERLQYIANEENLQITDEALSLIVRRADGGLRDAIGLLDQCAAFSADGNVASEQVLAVIGSLGEENTAALLTAIIQNDYNDLFIQIDEYLSMGKECGVILWELLNYLRQIMLLKIKQTDMVVLSEDILPRAQAQSRQISLKQLTALIDRLSKARSDLRFAEQGRIIVETALLECALLLNAAYEEEAPKEMPHIVKKAPVTKQTPASENTASQASVPSAQNVSDTPKIALEKPEDILKNWDKILNAIRTESIQIYAFLKEGRAMGLENDELIIKFDSKHKFHSNKINQNDNKKIIESVIERLTQRKVRLKIYYEEKDGDFAAKYDLAQKAKEVFGDILEEE